MTGQAMEPHGEIAGSGGGHLLRDTVVVLVHHRNHDLIEATSRSLIAQGFDPSQILVVDNSEEEEKAASLSAQLPDGTKLLFVPNRGYGNAVNKGVEYWARQSTDAILDFVLVATHEVAPRPYAVARLRSALESDPTAAAAGPTLISGDDEPFIWSAGGRLTKRLGIPRHFDHRNEFNEEKLKQQSAIGRAWLDGAFVLYRWAAVRDNPFDEGYFMYMEETDLHLRLAKIGAHVIWVPSAVVWQSSGGIPAYYLSRNLRLLYTRTDRRAQGRLAVPVDVGRRAISDIVNRRAGVNTFKLLRGLFARLPGLIPTDSPTAVINPLGGALRHYEDELRCVLGETGAGGVRFVSFPEPSISGKSRSTWILSYVRALRQARKQRVARLVVTWPVLGYLDVLLIVLFYRQPAWLVMHDPEPLVRAVGYGKLSILFARASSKFLNVIVHSHVALEVVERQGAYGSVVTLPHPVLPSRESKDQCETKSLTMPIVRVLGQFKPDRDLNALRAISARLGETATLEIFGRGWPQVEGWHVTEGFLSEKDMSEKLNEADVIVVPYARFFQSGVAIRALESGVAVVGPRVPSLVELFGPESRLLIDKASLTSGESWVRAIEWAIVHGHSEAIAAADRVYKSAVSEWSRWESATSVLVNRGADAE